jgi:hypothetical protein
MANGEWRMASGGSLFWSPVDSGEITRAVDNPHHLHPVFHQPIKRYPTFDDERPRAFSNLRTGGTELRMIPQELTAFLDAVMDSIGSLGFWGAI